MKNQKIIKIEVKNLESKRNLKAFRKLEKLNTDKAHKAYVKAQKNYISVLKKFIKQNVTDQNSHAERYISAAAYYYETLLEAYRDNPKSPEHKIKILNSLIGVHKEKLLNLEEWLDQ
jgi:hypothetical protein